jgi:DUF1365 family protein
VTKEEAATSLRLMRSLTVHQRETPFVRRFAYKMLFLDVNIDRAEQARGLARLLSINRAGLFSWHVKDHGARRENEGLRTWAENAFASAGLQLEIATLRLICLPRVLGYSFRPISVWLAFDHSDHPQGVIYEVNNTFGETHSYVAAIDADKVQHEAAKCFHVSPFFDVDGKYRFTLTYAPTGLKLLVETFVENRRTHLASLVCAAKPVSDMRLLRAFFGLPFMSFGVTLAIHWEALWLWLRGAGYRDKPELPSEAVSRALPMQKIARPLAPKD